MTAADVDPRDLLRSLASRLCPLCGGRKGEGKTVCFGCWRGVPAALRRRLYLPSGAGYEQAVADLFDLAGVSPDSLAARLGAASAGRCAECGGLEVIVDPGGNVHLCPHCAAQEVP